MDKILTEEPKEPASGSKKKNANSKLNMRN